MQQSSLVNPNVSSAAIQGHVIGGQQPISGATVTVWEVGTSGYGTGATQLASTVSDAGGNFQFSSGAYVCDFDNAPVYITASGGDSGGGINDNSVLASGLGTCGSAHTARVVVNEVTTAATAYALSHFFTTTLGGDYTTDLIGGPATGAGTYNPGLVLSLESTFPTLINLPSGLVNPSTASTTIESAKIYSIANTLAACVNTTGETNGTESSTACGQLFSDTTPPGGSRPADTFQAAVQMAIYPYQNVAALFNLATPASPFSGLAAAPTDWTVGVAYTSSGFGLGINGTTTSSTSSNIDIDATGRIWFPTNSTTSHGVAYFDPSTATFNGPYLTPLQHPQYLAVTNQGNVYASDLASNVIQSTSGDNFFTTGNTGPVAALESTNSSLDTIVYTGGGTSIALGSAVYQELSGTITPVDTLNQPATSLVAIYNAGTSKLLPYAATSGSATACDLDSPEQAGSLGLSSSPCTAGGIAIISSGNDAVITTSTNQICSFVVGCFTPAVGLSTPQAVAQDGAGNLWIANSANASVSTLFFNSALNTYPETSPVPYLHDANNGNTMTTPYGLAIDGSGNVWVSNAGCVDTTGTGCAAGTFVLSELVGAAAPTITPLAAQNTPEISGIEPNAVKARASKGRLGNATTGSHR